MQNFVDDGPNENFVPISGLGVNKNDKWQEAHDRLKRIRDFSHSVKVINTQMNKIWPDKVYKKKELSAREKAK